MGLNKQKGNMYGFITHTWNTIKGKCLYDCKYCYMKRFKQNEMRFDNKELSTDLGSNNFIFVGSSCDMFNSEVRNTFILSTIEHCKKFNNKYLFQSKNPNRFLYYKFPKNTIFCTTIETNREYNISNAPSILKRIEAMNRILGKNKKMITIEPIMDFDLIVFMDCIKIINPFQVNIGADSQGHNLKEPSKEKIYELINELKNNNIKVFVKDNLKRLVKERNDRKNN